MQHPGAHVMAGGMGLPMGMPMAAGGMMPGAPMPFVPGAGPGMMPYGMQRFAPSAPVVPNEPMFPGVSTLKSGNALAIAQAARLRPGAARSCALRCAPC
jgi:hypothetical protein